MRDTRRVSLAYVAVDMAKSMEVSISRDCRLSPCVLCLLSATLCALWRKQARGFCNYVPARNALIKDYGVCPTYRLEFPDSVINVVDNINPIFLMIFLWFVVLLCFVFRK